jgi:hypothetical protein
MTATTKPLLLMMVVWLSGSPAQTPIEDAPECTEQGMGKLQLSREDVTVLGLTIGRSSLKDVEAKLGETESLLNHGSASASNTICYVSPTDGTVLTFGASGMGGFKDVTEFAIWSREAKFPSVSTCRPQKLVSRGLSTASGIRLGLTTKQLSAIVGTLPKSRNAVVHYQLVCRQKMTADQIKGFKTANNWDVSENPYFDVSSFVEAHFINSETSRISVAKIESY